MVNRKLMTVWAGVALAAGVASWGQNAEAPKPEAAAPAKPEAAAPAKPEAAAPAKPEAAAPAAPKAPAAIPAPPTRQRGVGEINPERMKDMQKLQGLRREYHMTRRAVTEKQQVLLNNPEVDKQVKVIEEQITKLQAEIRKLEDGKPEIFRKADASLQAEYDKMAETEKQIQELEKKLYPARPSVLGPAGASKRPAVVPPPPPAPAAVAPAPAAAPAAKAEGK